MIALFLEVSTVQNSGNVSNCFFNQETAMSLSSSAFDQDLDGGWRRLSNQGCYKEAADLLHRYRERLTVASPNSEVRMLYWHEGQMRAYAGQTKEAIPLMLNAVPLKDERNFSDYALGTVAFLQRDLPALKSARARLAKLPQPVDWASASIVKMKLNGVPMIGRLPWPPNLNVLDGLIACFDRPYSTAYGPTCTKSFQLRPMPPDIKKTPSPR